MNVFQRMRAEKIAFLLAACFLLVPTILSAQQARISLTRGEMMLSELFGEIKRQTGTVVVFDAGNVVPENRVTLPTGEIALTELLNGALPKSKYAWRKIGTYVVVRTLGKPSAVDAVAPQPSQEEFERDVAEYTRRNLGKADDHVVVRYDTIRNITPHDGRFEYPGREFTPVVGSRETETSLGRTTPPILAVKTNLAWWAARGTLNIGGEVGLGKRTSIELSAGLNRWTLKGSNENNRKLAHWIIKPEFRYWFCERFSGHFLGVHALYGQYNVGGLTVPLLFDKKFRYEGWAAGAGINYGYHLPLAKRWGLEFTLGIGAARLDYKKSDCLKCGEVIGRETKTYFGPTEMGVKVVFLIR
jgi:hypothetical protein